MLIRSQRDGSSPPGKGIKVLSAHYKKGIAEKIMMPALRFINNQRQAFLSRGLLCVEPVQIQSEQIE